LALEYLDSADVVYGDLKPENVVLDVAGHCKLTDLGSCHDRRDVAVSRRVEGTVEYLAPELRRGQVASTASDLWALGLVIHQLLAGRLPLGLDDVDADSVPAEKRVEFQPIDLQLSDDLCETAADLVSCLVTLDPAHRLGAQSQWASLKQHAMFTGCSIEWESLSAQTPPTPAQGAVAPEKAAKWNRRKNSVIWCPMPARYDGGGALDMVAESPDELLWEQCGSAEVGLASVSEGTATDATDTRPRPALSAVSRSSAFAMGKPPRMGVFPGRGAPGGPLMPMPPRP